jgi:hypothetical protein
MREKGIFRAAPPMPKRRMEGIEGRRGGVEQKNAPLPAELGAFGKTERFGVQDQSRHALPDGLQSRGAVLGTIEERVGGEARMTGANLGEEGKPPARPGETPRPGRGEEGERLRPREQGALLSPMQDHRLWQHHGLTPNGLTPPSPSSKEGR